MKKILEKRGKASLVGEFEDGKLVRAYILKGKKRVPKPALEVDYRRRSGKVTLDGDWLVFEKGVAREKYDNYIWGDPSEGKKKMSFEAWLPYALEQMKGYLNFYK